MTLLLVASICGNFWIGGKISGYNNSTRMSRRWMIVGVTANLVLLGYFKYANFFVDNLNTALDLDWSNAKILLPIGISFFTFTQIAFLADSHLKGTRESNFFHYGLFVTYFPHLVAGPVLHHAQMMPQFKPAQTYRFDQANFVAGMTIFAIGLFKKIVLADGISPYADAVFKPSDAGLHPQFSESWLGVLAYTFQLYFDFSGYSDMAIGLSWMFNIRLPFNFDSPYKATSISDFWRRWHISLSNFLRDYLYIAMGGNRFGNRRRYINLMATMVLGGLWHGASWSFVIWGFLHGIFLWINHAFRAACGTALTMRLDASRCWSLFSWGLTLLCVMTAWVLFRAETISGAGRILAGMVNLGPVSQAGIDPLLWNAGLHLSTGLSWCLALGLIAFLAPNSNKLGIDTLALLKAKPMVRAVFSGAAVSAIGLLVLLNLSRNSVSAFIYFNF